MQLLLYTKNTNTVFKLIPKRKATVLFFVYGQVYYPVRHHLVQHMISAMQRLGFTPSVTIEQRKLAVDLAEVVIKWELQRIKDQQVRRIQCLV